MVNIKVAVRIRPLSRRELTQKDETVVQTSDRLILVTNKKVPERQGDGDSRPRVRRFAVDFCYDPTHPNACTQESVYQDVGKEVLESMFSGYNACVLAYGHSASGKTYTMMGSDDEPGLTPRICRGLFRKMDDEGSSPRVRFHTVISFLEIYNERVRDLLVTDDAGGGSAAGNFSLRVREHPKLGPYVQDLSQHEVDDEDRILEYLAAGNSRRSTAATENNSHSSRSHAVFTIRFKRRADEDVAFGPEVTSKVHLVDLAGSLQETPYVKSNERAGTSQQSKTRLKEGANINKSLVTLGNVISALAESCETFVNPARDHAASRTWQPFVPYRDSVLTWLLKDTLGGNSNTIMIATVSPASSCVSETINTLRYAKRTKRIVNQPIVNEDPKIRTIRELKEEIAKLRNVILSYQAVSSGDSSIAANRCLDGGRGSSAEEDGKRRRRRGDGLFELDILPVGESASEDAGKEGSLGGANSISGDASNKINAEKKADVNGSVIDKPVRERQVLSDSVESLSRERATATSGRRRRTRRAVTTESVDREERRRSKKRRRFDFFRRRRGLSKSRLGRGRRDREATMLRRSRPDLIKGIASRSKDGLPSTSSQSFTDVSGLSASENSLNSSGSADSHNCWKPGGDRKAAADARKTESKESVSAKGSSRQSSIGDGSGSSTPTQIPKPVPKRRATDKRSEIVAAVTTRLYATKKKPDPRMEALQSVDKDDYDDGEIEELKLCKRARMKLFDLSRKLAMTRRGKKTADCDTQTDFATATVRVKEKCTVTDQSGILRYETSATNTPLDANLKSEEERAIVMNQVFIPRNGSCVVECGRRNLRIEVPKTEKCESGTQTERVEAEEEFSDDSLEGADGDSPVPGSEKSVTKEPTGSCDSLPDSQSHKLARPDRTWLPITRYPISGTNAVYEYDPNKSVPDVIYGNAGDDSSRAGRAEIALPPPQPPPPPPLFNGLPLAVFSGEDVATAAGETASSENSLASSNEGSDAASSDTSSSSSSSGGDFVFYEPPKECASRQSGLGNLYTITENSEHNDVTSSESQQSSLQALEEGAGGAAPVSVEDRVEDVKVADGETESRDSGPEATVNVSGEVKDAPEEFRSKKKGTKKTSWAESTSQRQFLNFNILGSRQAGRFSIDSNMFGEKRQGSEVKFPSEDSITFVFMAPTRQKTSVLMEIIKRSMGRGSSSEGSFGSQRKSRNRGVQCKLMRSVSVDTAMMALSRFAKHQRPGQDMGRTSSLDTLVPEEMQTILEQGRLHGCMKDGPDRKPPVAKCNMSTWTTRDQGTETDKYCDKTDKSSMTTCLVDAACDAIPSEEKDFDEYYPELPRTRTEAATKSRWREMKDVILGVADRIRSDEEEEEEERKPRKNGKSVSWSDLSGSEELVEVKAMSPCRETPDESPENPEAKSASRFVREDDELPERSPAETRRGIEGTAASPFREEDESPERSPSQTRRVRFTEPQRPCPDESCHGEAAANMTAFLNEAVQLLKNLNHLSQKYELSDRAKRTAEDEEVEEEEEGSEDARGAKANRKKETSVQTDGQEDGEASLSAESSPMRRARTPSRKAAQNLTWPRQRPASATGKPPTGLKYRAPLPSRSPSASSFDAFNKNDLESSSTSTNWNISNLSTTFSNSYSGCSRPSSSKSFYSEKSRDAVNKYWTRSKIPSPKYNSELESDLEESCRRLEIAVERDRLREENSVLKMSTLTPKKSTGYGYPRASPSLEVAGKRDNDDGSFARRGSAQSFASQRFDYARTATKAHGHVRKKPCKCYCHYRNTSRVYRSSLELETRPPVDQHCHACCTPCSAVEPELRSSSAPALNSICDSEDNKCRLFYYGYCPCSPVKLNHVTSSPRAYMQHLLSLRRQIVNKTREQYGSAAT